MGPWRTIDHCYPCIDVAHTCTHVWAAKPSGWFMATHACLRECADVRPCALFARNMVASSDAREQFRTSPSSSSKPSARRPPPRPRTAGTLILAGPVCSPNHAAQITRVSISQEVRWTWIKTSNALIETARKDAGRNTHVLDMPSAMPSQRAKAQSGPMAARIADPGESGRGDERRRGAARRSMGWHGAAQRSTQTCTRAHTRTGPNGQPA